MPPVFLGANKVALSAHDVAIGVVKSSDVTRPRDDDVALRIQRHGENVVAQFLVGVERDAKPGRHAQTEFLDRHQREKLGEAKRRG